MPVRNKKSDLYDSDQDPAKARGRPIVITFTATNAADDDAGSTFVLCELPSYAILDANTTITADTWGYATTQIGIPGALTGLVNAARNAAHVPVTRNGALHGLPLWQAMGLSADPGGMIPLIATAPANATGAGTMRGEIHYRFR